MSYRTILTPYDSACTTLPRRRVLGTRHQLAWPQKRPGDKVVSRPNLAKASRCSRYDHIRRRLVVREQRSVQWTMLHPCVPPRPWTSCTTTLCSSVSLDNSGASYSGAYMCLLVFAVRARGEEFEGHLVLAWRLRRVWMERGAVPPF